MSSTTPDPTQFEERAIQWRLRYHVGDVVHYTEWTADFPAIENLYEQYRRGAYGHDVAIERRATVSR